jgi:integrase
VLTSHRISDIVNVYLREHAPHVVKPDFLAATAEPIITWWGDKTLADIRGKSCRDYVTWRTAQRIRHRKNDVRVSTATARHDLKTLQAAVRHFHREYGPLDAVPTVTLPDKSAARERWLSWQEARKAIQASAETEHLRRFLILGLHTGTRSAAILGLRWVQSLDSGWVDLDGGMLHRAGPKQRATKKKQPSIQIPPRLMRHLVAWHTADARHGITHVVHYQARKLVKLRRSWDTMCDRAQLGADVTPHTLRHTATTWLLRSGRDPWAVAGFVGMTMETLDRTYGHHSPKLQKKLGTR